jgi:hypothetical protein
VEERRVLVKRVFIAALGLLSFAGCATLQTSDTYWTEQALASAGFERRPADTPEKLAQLTALTPRRLMRKTLDGEVRYVYADPTRCTCLYVGGDLEYQRFRQQEEAAASQVFDNGGGVTTGAGVDRRFLEKLQPLDMDECFQARGLWDAETRKCDLPN